MRPASKGSLYRNEVTEAAVAAVREALRQIAAGHAPTPPNAIAGAQGRQRPPMRQPDRAIDWQRDPAAAVLRKLRAADGTPGVADEVLGLRVHCYDAHPEPLLRGAPGDVIARRDGAICRATVDGADASCAVGRAGQALFLPQKPPSRAARFSGDTLPPSRRSGQMSSAEAAPVIARRAPFDSGALNTTSPLTERQRSERYTVIAKREA